MKVGDTVFDNAYFSARPKYIKKIKYIDDAVYVMKDVVNGMLGAQNTYYLKTIGEVFANELDVPLEYMFKKPNAKTEYMVDKKGLHEYRDGVWVNVSGCFEKTEIFDFWVNGGKFEIGAVLESSLYSKFYVGKKIKGLHNHYGITNEEMKEAVITSIKNMETGLVDITVLNHVEDYYIGRNYEVNLFDPGNPRKWYFECL